jgi:hypothetical protein
MQARLTINRLPSILVAIVFALVAALLLGGALGYALKPVSTAAGPARVIVIPSTNLGNPAMDERCVFVDKQKQC